MTLSERFKAERERLGFTQPAVAALAEVGKTTVINWEKGSSSPTALQLELLAKFGFDVLYVVTGEHAGGVAPAPTLSSDEKLLLDSYREAPTAVRKAALAALLSGRHTNSQSVVGNNAIQIGSVSGKARVKNK